MELPGAGLSVETMASTGASGEGYLRSRLLVTSTASGEIRAIEHFWFNSWPDHGVPRNAQHPLYVDSTIELIASVNDARREAGGGPVLVHCSAGIGRTGTYIAIDHGIALLNRDVTFKRN